MIRISSRSLFVLGVLLLSTLHNPKSAAGAPFGDRGNILLQLDFNSAGTSPTLSASVAPKSAAIVHASTEAVGTVDVFQSTTPSGAARLTVASPGTTPWRARMSSGLQPIHNREKNLGKLTLSFDHSVSYVRPITVQIESFNSNRKRTGGLEGVVYPAGADFFIRAALELSTMRPFGTGKFEAADPFVEITFTINGAENSCEMRIDNIAYATPAYYVSPSGSDKNDGRTEKTAFADPEKAVGLARPGDIILLMDGTYKRAPTTPEGDGIIGFRHGGSPAEWVVLKNYPGQHPILATDGWNAIKIGRGSSEAKTLEPALAYIEIRGLHIRGNALEAKEKYPDDMDEARASTNGNGISGDGRGETNPPHHLRFADNVVELCPGGGISTMGCDRVTTENNDIWNNCWWNIYACSGTSFLGAGNFDASVGNYKVLIRNNRIFGNEGLLPWKAIGKMSDSNGIIIDSIQGFNGRVLIQSNLCVNNGGSGIHVFRGQRIDIINNTAYMNGAAPLLRWGQIFVQNTDDARIVNNILVSRPGQPINSVGSEIDDRGCTNIRREANLMFGGTAAIKGVGDLVADPLFVFASKNHLTADFHLKPGSPAVGSGRHEAFSPLIDLDGKPRRTDIPARGAFESRPATAQ